MQLLCTLVPVEVLDGREADHLAQGFPAARLLTGSEKSIMLRLVHLKRSDWVTLPASSSTVMILMPPNGASHFLNVCFGSNFALTCSRMSRDTVRASSQIQLFGTCSTHLIRNRAVTA